MLKNNNFINGFSRIKINRKTAAKNILHTEFNSKHAEYFFNVFRVQRIWRM